MKISTPTKSGVPIEKDIVVNVGVKFRMEGLRMSVTGRVLKVNEEEQTVVVEGDFGKETIHLSRIIDTIPDITLDEAQNKPVDFGPESDIEYVPWS